MDKAELDFAMEAARGVEEAILQAISKALEFHEVVGAARSAVVGIALSHAVIHYTMQAIPNLGDRLFMVKTIGEHMIAHIQELLPEEMR